MCFKLGQLSGISIVDVTLACCCCCLLLLLLLAVVVVVCVLN